MKRRLNQAALRQPRFGIIEQQAATDFLRQQSVRRIFAIVFVVFEQNVFDVIGMTNQVHDQFVADLITHDVAELRVVAQQRLNRFFPITRRTLENPENFGAGRTTFRVLRRAFWRRFVRRFYDW